MSAQIEYTNLSYKAPFYTEGIANADKLWFVFHGYGQLAPYFMRKFNFLDDNTLIVAPQGLSSFYLEGTSGRVGASWMTKENRELAIQNYVAYLSSTYNQVIKKMKAPPKQVTMLGFSQGVSTLIRWLVSSEIDFAQLIMCAGSFPDDIDMRLSKKIFLRKPCYYLYGDQDSFIKKENIAQLEGKFHQYGLEVDFRQFEGRHEISQELLKQLV